jgi:hypothetical protein
MSSLGRLRAHSRPAIVAGVVLALVGRAGATPRIDLTRCTAFDELALRRAIIHELPNASTRDFTVVVSCPDLVTAKAYIDPQPGDGALVREINLGEVSADQRIRLLALAIAGLVDAAAESQPPIFVPEQPPGVAPTKSDKPAKVEPPAKPDEPKPKAVATAVEDAPHDRDVVASAAPVAPGGHNAWSIAPRIGARVFPATPRPLVEVGAEVAYARFRLGVDGAVGQQSADLGTLRPYLVTATLARELVCAHAVCALARIEGGLAGVSAEASGGATAHSARAAYGQAGLGGEWSHAFADWSLIAALDVAWAEGVIARVNGSDAVQLAGLTMSGAIGARWR